MYEAIAGVQSTSVDPYINQLNADFYEHFIEY